jgi:hypothetical protein
VSIILTSAIPIYGIQIDSQVKEVVAFIFIPNPDPQHKDEPIPYGTGFFISIKDNKDPKKLFCYFVTAKHVLQKEDQKTWLSEILVRMNKNDNTSEYISVILFPDGDKKNIFTLEDPTVDLAVLHAHPDVEKYKFKVLPEDYLTTKEDFQKLQIKEGTDVFFTGLFTRHYGQERNYPIVRYGRVALITDEKVFIDKNTKADLYLIEANAYGGNSGSPVFFFLGSDRVPGGIIAGPPIIKLAGVISLHFNETIPVEFIAVPKNKKETTSTDANITTVPIVTPNIGIAGVVPAYKLQEILFGKELTEKRNAVIQHN